MKLDSICDQIYVIALNEARINNHEYLTPEHFLYAAMMFDLGKELIIKSNGDLSGIQVDLLEFFETKMPKRTINNPKDSFEFVRMFELATAQAHGSGKQTVILGNIFAAIFNLPECFAAYFMAKNGVSKLELLRLVSDQMASHENQENDSSLNILKKFSTNLTEKASKNQLDPLIGREDIINRTIQVLCRRLKNNPIHVGDPGVGKTAIIEGIAQKIFEGNVPNVLLNSQIFYIDMGSLIAGTKYRGDFEERLIKVIEIIGKLEKPIVYFDEIHTLVGAGAVGSGGMDASNILKPYLVSGNIKFIGSTTFEEYKKFFEKDRALSRRFQKIDIPEPTLEESVKILLGIKSKYEQFHNVYYSEDIIELICQLTTKHMNDRFMPDKAIDVLDESGAYLSIHGGGSSPQNVTHKYIERTISLMAKIPENIVSANEIVELKTLSQRIREQIYGQDDAIDTIVDAIKASRSGLKDPDKPIANLLFVGPTGVGKTELAKQLAENLKIKLLRYDMSEYQEKHSVARLIGSPPGYIGYEEGGLLTETIRRTPHCVLLLDEIEKAHPDIYNVLLQIMDYGSLTDNSGKKSDFTNVIIIMTSNAGAKEIGKKIIGYGKLKEGSQAINKEVEKIFNPEFRNRLDAVVVFNSLNIKMANLIITKSINKLGERLKDKNISIKVSASALEYISSKGFSEKFGAREIMRVINKEVKKLLVDEVLFGKLSDGGSAIIDFKNQKIVLRARSSRRKNNKT